MEKSVEYFVTLTDPHEEGELVRYFSFKTEKEVTEFLTLHLDNGRTKLKSIHSIDYSTYESKSYHIKSMRNYGYGHRDHYALREGTFS